MIQSQVTQMTCGDCRHLFQEETPVEVPVHMWAGWVRAIRCPSCGSAKVLFGQNRTVSEDAGFEHGGTLPGRVARWLVDGERGVAAEAVHGRMSGQWTGGKAHPEDASDLRRCMLLLARIPEWRPRMAEMVGVSEEWGRFSRAWPMLEALFREEAGPDLSRVSTPRTSALVAACAGKGEVFLRMMEEMDAAP